MSLEQRSIAMDRIEQQFLDGSVSLWLSRSAKALIASRVPTVKDSVFYHFPRREPSVKRLSRGNRSVSLRIGI